MHHKLDSVYPIGASWVAGGKAAWPSDRGCSGPSLALSCADAGWMEAALRISVQGKLGDCQQRRGRWILWFAGVVESERLVGSGRCEKRAV
jgi:hypothetical protein